MSLTKTAQNVARSLYRKATSVLAGAHADVGSSKYARRLLSEKETYANCLNVNDLPAIFHYWSNKYLRPKFAQFGFENPDEFFALYLERSARAISRVPRFVSIGAGNCDTEVRVAKLLVARGIHGFCIECVDINEAMLRRGRALADEAGVGAHIVTAASDFNEWRPSGQYDAVVANQSLHHVVDLEHLFHSIHDAIGENGLFITSDMIGRNGHQRWPEALEIVEEYWEQLPKSYRYNQQLRRQEDTFLDWDCSVSGFEGIRSQDILPLLVRQFDFDLFVPFTNVVDPFIDRSFGHNFNAEAEWDRGFIDQVHARDELELAAGRITPTHMLAVMRRGHGQHVYLDGRSPERCIRNTKGNASDRACA
jgi:SAM-dependent methyltransferase